MLKTKRFGISAALILLIFALAFPAGPVYSMSRIKTWVNKVRPGTFPEMESRKGTAAEPTEAAGPAREALTETERQILLGLKERKRQLDERDLLLNQREEQLRALRDNVQRQVTELKRLQGQIEASMEAKKAQDAENLGKVVSLYNGMDPKRAAEKFEVLDPKVAVQILLSMNQRKAAALLEELPPDQAKRITEEIIRKVPSPN